MLEEDQSQKLSKNQLLKQYMHPQVNPLLNYINSPNPNIFLFLHMQNVLLNKINSRGNRYHNYTRINYQFQVFQELKDLYHFQIFYDMNMLF